MYRQHGRELSTEVVLLKELNLCRFHVLFRDVLGSDETCRGEMARFLAPDAQAKGNVRRLYPADSI